MYRIYQYIYIVKIILDRINMSSPHCPTIAQLSTIHLIVLYYKLHEWQVTYGFGK